MCEPNSKNVSNIGADCAKPIDARKDWHFISSHSDHLSPEFVSLHCDQICWKCYLFNLSKVSADVFVKHAKHISPSLIMELAFHRSDADFRDVLNVMRTKFQHCADCDSLKCENCSTDH